MERDGCFRVSVYSGSCILLEWLDTNEETLLFHAIRIVVVFPRRCRVAMFVGPFGPILPLVPKTAILTPSPPMKNPS